MTQRIAYSSAELCGGITWEETPEDDHEGRETVEENLTKPQQKRAKLIADLQARQRKELQRANLRNQLDVARNRIREKNDSGTVLVLEEALAMAKELAS